jgi:glutamate formiminotransferase/glutamate formiminotransferase/formiminotetrahydrofolate cyclodeaminase
MLLGVPNFSEGRDTRIVELVTSQFIAGADLLDSHSDPVHNRTVLTLTAPPKFLGENLARGSGACAVMINMNRHDGAHPCIGSLDVCPLVYTDEGDRDTAREVAGDVARAIAGDGIPVFLYGELASAPEREERAYFRKGGIGALRERMASGELRPDLGPPVPHPAAGATLVTARPPLAAFNIVLEGTDMEGARAIAAGLRESGGGPPGVRAIAVDLGEGGLQVSTNVHDPLAVPLAAVVERVMQLGGRPAAAEIVALVPEAALGGFPDDLPLPGFDRERQVIERVAN